jgi:uncharacterized membrane protein
MSGPPHEAEWRDPSNWRAGWLRVYVAPRDPRVLVPMRPRWLGWTLNLGQRRTWALIVVVAALMAAIVALVATMLGAPGGSGITEGVI